MMMDELTLGPVGPLRHMGVVVARHSTQPLEPLPATATPSICSRHEAEARSATRSQGAAAKIEQGEES